MDGWMDGWKLEIGFGGLEKLGGEESEEMDVLGLDVIRSFSFLGLEMLGWLVGLAGWV